MEVVRSVLCARDVLVEYGKLMRYTPAPTGEAYCYDGPLALRQFGPEASDAANVLETYPWCAALSTSFCGKSVESCANER